MKLTENVLRNFLVAKIFRENTDRINSLDYSSNGETLISSSDDDSIIIYDCQNGTYASDIFISLFLGVGACNPLDLCTPWNFWRSTSLGVD